MRDRYLYLAAGFLLAVGLASAPAQHHPLSQLFPADTDLDIGGKDIENVSQIEAAVLRANATGTADLVVRDSGGTDILKWDDSAGVWRVKNSNINVSDNNVTDVDKLDVNGKIVVPVGPDAGL